MPDATVTARARARDLVHSAHKIDFGGWAETMPATDRVTEALAPMLDDLTRCDHLLGQVIDLCREKIAAAGPRGEAVIPVAELLALLGAPLLAAKTAETAPAELPGQLDLLEAS